MLTPPYHFSIVASPTLPAERDETSDSPRQILYRGSIPAARNLPFLRRLNIRTIVYLRKKELDDHDASVIWAKKRDVDLKWVKASGMSEEKLGIGRTEVGDVVRIILDPASYPLYIADTDGISHTTLIIACLRKLQGWHMDSIIDEIYRFEPDHEDLPLIPFITSYLTTSESPLVLPQPPYPSWLWPTSSSSSSSSSSSTLSPIPSAAPPPTKRDRTTSTSQPPSNPSESILPFPHPLTSRKHPTMRLTFPQIPSTSSGTASPLSLSRSNTIARFDNRVEEGGVSLMGVMAGIAGMDALGGEAGTGKGPGKGKERDVARLDDVQQVMPSGQRPAFAGSGSTEGDPAVPIEIKQDRGSNAESTGSVVISPAGELGSGSDDERMVESSGDVNDDYEEEEEEDEDEEDEDEGETDLTSQYISALDLAGFG